MKKIILVCLLTLTTNTFVKAQDAVSLSEDNLKWEQKFKNAKELSKASKKPLLIFFTGSDWCGPCKMLVEDFFESERFKKLAEKDFILYEANYPRNLDLVTSSQKEDNLMLKKKYGINSYPTIIVVDGNEKILGIKKSYNLMRDASYHFDFVESLLNK